MLLATLLFSLSATGGWALTFESIDGGTAQGRAALADPDQRLERNLEERSDGTTSFKTGSGTFSYGFTARSSQRPGASLFDRMGPGSDRNTASPVPGAPWR